MDKKIKPKDIISFDFKEIEYVTTLNYINLQIYNYKNLHVEFRQI